MNTKHNTCLDLSKLSEEEIKEIKDLTNGYVDKISKYPLLFWDEIEWNQAEKDDQNYIPNLTEISFEEWKSMMEGTSEGNSQVEHQRLISLENFLRDKLDEIESMHDYSVATDTIRCWIGEYNGSETKTHTQ